MEMLEIMKSRHSVRQYKATPIEDEKRQILNGMVAEINEKHNLHIQIVYDEPKCFDSFMAHYGKFSGVCNYIALVGDKSSELDIKLGYYGEKLVLKAQELGLNTCWVALTHGRPRIEIQKNEKLICLISLGYGEAQGVAHKSKPIEELCAYSNALPDWFISGMEGAMLAPTAMNQQKFNIALTSDGAAEANFGKGFYTKLDIGIVKYHFDVISGKKLAVK